MQHTLQNFLRDAQLLHQRAKRQKTVVAIAVVDSGVHVEGQHDDGLQSGDLKRAMN